MRKNYKEECEKRHNYKYDYSLSIFKSKKDKINIICPIHGEFQQRLDSHLIGSGCKKCHIDNIKFIKNINSEISHFNKCKIIHNNKYDYSLSYYTNVLDKINIICPIHGEFEQQLVKHMKGMGCKKCYNDKLRLTLNNFIEKSNVVHNYNWDYSLVDYINHMTKVKIICNEHGIFEQTPNNHLKGKGCPKCARNYKISDTEILNKANEKHNYKYDYSLSIFNSVRDKIKIICPIHGEFEQSLNTHLHSSGCQKCRKLINDTTDFIKISKITHNDTYNYSDTEYFNMKTKVKIECKKHGFFYQYPAHHIQGCGCPKCKISKGEQVIEKYLIENNIIYETQKTFKECKYKYVLRFDFYLPEYNSCVEYDGEQHHTSVNYWGGETTLKIQITKDDIKTNYCKKNNINLLRINYDENIIEILQTYFFNNTTINKK